MDVGMSVWGAGYFNPNQLHVIRMLHDSHSGCCLGRAGRLKHMRAGSMLACLRLPRELCKV